MNDMTSLRAGSSKILTTPSQPIPLAGFYDRQGPFEGVHDDLYVRTLVFESGNTRAAIVSVDICLMSEWFWRTTSEAIEQSHGIPRDHLFLNATHTHGGPALLDPPDESILDISFMNDHSFDEPRRRYTNDLRQKIVRSVGEALSNMSSARIGTSSGASNIGVNRRHTTEAGTAIGVNPEGTVDRELIVVRVDSEDGRPIAALFNLAVHGVSMMSKELTGDWCGIASQQIEESIGDGVIAPFLSGAAGNINPHILARPDFGGRDGDANTLATAVTETVSSLYNSIKPAGNGPVGAIQKEAALPGKRYLGLLGFDPAYEEIARDTSPVPDTILRMTALRAGGVLFGGTNAETFCEIGMEFKKRAPFDTTVFCGITNGYMSYIPSDDELKRGGYEYNASLVKSGGQHAIVDTLLKLSETLT